MQRRFNFTTLRASAVGALATVGIATSVQADLVTVCLDGSCDFTSPVAAVNAAAAGETIEIAAGTYLLSETISLYQKNLVIRGAVDAGGRPATVLNGQNATYHINALHLTAATAIENLVLTSGRSTQFSAIYMFGCVGTTFRNCAVCGNHGGAIGLTGASVTMIGRVGTVFRLPSRHQWRRHRRRRGPGRDARRLGRLPVRAFRGSGPVLGPVLG